MTKKITPTKKSKLPLKKKRLRDINLFIKDRRDYFEDVPQHLLGISDQQLGRLFENAWAFIEIHEAAEAVRGFRLLCSLHPFVSDFWYGLAHSLQESGMYDEARDAYLMAETMDPTQYSYYQEAIECCLELGDKRAAERIFHRLLSHKRVIYDFDSHQHEIQQFRERINV